ncbi:homogentisate 1,2-dioxygenase, partial [Noviherbaspirillum denitrificans]|uniref:homogentisate 1,2-dioxygenase n=1 Tax=Noviherbaspirillum denitrificans TaxID=1968433 RepID=UPI001F1A6F6B
MTQNSSFDNLSYQHGFGNQFSTESEPGALPIGRNSPQRAPLGLYSELLSGTAFTAPRAVNMRTWMYRILPSAAHGQFRKSAAGARIRSAPLAEAEVPANRLRWDPFPIPAVPTDFIDGLSTIAVNGKIDEQTGCAVHVYCASKSMGRRYFLNADGEMMLVPQAGALALCTELGRLRVQPGEIAVIPRGIHFKVDLLDKDARGYVCENYGQPFRLPELGPIGSNGLANARDFLYPHAAYEQVDGEVSVV